MNTMLTEIKAVVRIELTEQVVTALKEAGVPRLTVTHVRSVGSGVDPKNTKFSLELGTGYTEKALVQFVCDARRVEYLVGTITKHGQTGTAGDGVVFVTPVDRVVKIRTGVEGAEALI
ncbi:MAG: P-II family nitrogen regulator [Gemmatimonadales bacterium]|nr:P-II family nitrogen regulator [Gemmatimonadales bacterium]